MLGATVMAVCLGVGVTACSGSASSKASRPPGRSPRSLSAVFDALPRYPRSRAASSRTKSTAGVLIQSFTVNGVTPDQLMTWFGDQLSRSDWIPVPTSQQGTDRRREWKRQHRTLVVTSAPAKTAGASATPTSQYSLLLSPEGVPAP